MARQTQATSHSVSRATLSGAPTSHSELAKWSSSHPLLIIGVALVPVLAIVVYFLWQLYLYFQGDSAEAAKAERQQAEAAKQESLRLESQAYEEQRQAKADREKAEAERQQAEAAKQESLRLEAQAREEQRQAKPDRDAAKAERQQAEAARQESLRLEAQAREEQRQAKADRQKAEAERQQAEAAKQESLRLEAQAREEQRQAKADREKAEAERQQAEADLKAAKEERGRAEQARSDAEKVNAATKGLINSHVASAFADAELRPTLEFIVKIADGPKGDPVCLAARCVLQGARALTILAEARESPDPPSFDEFRAVVLLLGRTLASLINGQTTEPAMGRAEFASWAKAVNSLTKGILVVGAPMIGEAFDRLKMESQGTANGAQPTKVSHIYNWWVINERGITQTKTKVS